MNRSAYSQGKQEREKNKARKKKEKAKRLELRREQASDPLEIVTCDEIVGHLPTTTEAMRTMDARAKLPRASAPVPCRLFVGNLSWDCADETLRDLFAQFGVVLEAVIVKDRNTGQSRGFGFVTFENRKDASQAIEELNGYELDGRNIAVNIATKH